MACDNIEELFEELSVEYNKSRRFYVGPCPVHGGDNVSAWNLYPEGDDVRGFWKCRTHHCEKKWKRTLIGFVHGVLSRQANRDIPWTKAVDWLVDFMGYESLFDVPKPSEDDIQRRKQATMIHRLSLAPEPIDQEWSRAKIRTSLQIPDPYYLGRGYSKEVLDRYDVGFHARSQRVVVPIYDLLYNTIIGFTARSIHEKCLSCNLYHNPQHNCPTEIGAIINAGKWKNSPGFNRSDYLYNAWFAKQHILQSGTVILVEGPSDIWRLVEAEIYNGLAVFGTEMTPMQLIALRKMGAYLKVILLADNDSAGAEANNEWRKQLERQYQLYIPKMHTNDLGDMEVKQVKDFIGSII